MTRTQPHEIDLHGLTIDQALARFSQAYDRAESSGRGTRLIVIHGWNTSDFRGSIAAALHRLLKNCAIDFEHPFEGNRGRTSVRAGPPLTKGPGKPRATKAVRTAPGPLLGGL